MTVLAEARLCACGCGEPTTIATQNRPALGMVKGQPNRYLNGHHSRTPNVPACGYIVDSRGCWVWQLTRDRTGYGRMQTASGSRRAHAVHYEQAYGRVPEGLELDHLCRNRACVNPDHLEPVPHAVNMRRSASTKLNADDAAAIRADPRPQRVIAADYGVDQTTISHIKRGKTWC